MSSSLLRDKDQDYSLDLFKHAVTQLQESKDLTNKGKEQPLKNIDNDHPKTARRLKIFENITYEEWNTKEVSDINED